MDRQTLQINNAPNRDAGTYTSQKPTVDKPFLEQFIKSLTLNACRPMVIGVVLRLTSETLLEVDRLPVLCLTPLDNKPARRWHTFANSLSELHTPLSKKNGPIRLAMVVSSRKALPSSCSIPEKITNALIPFKLSRKHLYLLYNLGYHYQNYWALSRLVY